MFNKKNPLFFLFLLAAMTGAGLVLCIIYIKNRSADELIDEKVKPPAVSASYEEYIIQRREIQKKQILMLGSIKSILQQTNSNEIITRDDFKQLSGLLYNLGRNAGSPYMGKDGQIYDWASRNGRKLSAFLSEEILSSDVGSSTFGAFVCLACGMSEYSKELIYSASNSGRLKDMGEPGGGSIVWSFYCYTFRALASFAANGNEEVKQYYMKMVDQDQWKTLNLYKTADIGGENPADYAYRCFQESMHLIPTDFGRSLVGNIKGRGDYWVKGNLEFFDSLPRPLDYAEYRREVLLNGVIHNKYTGPEKKGDLSEMRRRTTVVPP